MFRRFQFLGLFLFFFCAILIQESFGQYFGRNRPKYEQRDFKILETDNFEIHHYLEGNREVLERFAREAEQWYANHLRILGDTIWRKNPIILYNNHADFQQTNAIFGQIGVGTGGVTEALKNRVIMPLGFTNQQTTHVLGHELVHAFQFNSILEGENSSIRNLQNLPLWFVEGMAEYMSLGRVDPHTAMWMRDAVIHEDIPSISSMSNYSRYFPYRFGQAFIAFITGIYGDDILYPLMMGTALFGFDQAVRDLFNVDVKTLSDLWVQSIQRGFEPYVKNKDPKIPGKELLIDTRSGNLTISPSISPDGKYVIFLSEKGIFNLDLYLADANTGLIIRKITTQTRQSEVEELNFLESSGTWSPNSKEFAYVGFQRGRNVLVICDVERPRRKRIISIPNLAAFTNPAWSPDGRHMLLSGKRNGQTDLYIYNLRNGQLKQITDDPYAQIHGSWSPDGSNIVYATDEWSFRADRPGGQYTFNIAMTDIDGNRNVVYNLLNGANNLNPVMDGLGYIYFLSDRDGYRNLYRFDPRKNELEQLTQFATGISGLTPYAPAISLSYKLSRPILVYTLFYNRRYSLYIQLLDRFEAKPVDKDAIDMSAAVLPPGNNKRSNLVAEQMKRFPKLEDGYGTIMQNQPYRSRFRLDYISGGTGMGLNTANAFGTNALLAGGVDMIFSDMLGDQLMFAGLALNGEIFDAGGVLQYINRKRRLQWGAAVSHIPFRTGTVINRGLVLLEDQFGNRIPAFQYDLFVQRIFQDQLSVMIQYPFSTVRRVEVGSGYALFYDRVDLISNFYNDFGFLIFQDRRRLSSSGALHMFFNNAAFVGDNSFFGMASPMTGGRYRVAGELYWGDLQYQTHLFDFRKYHFAKPFNFSYRLLQYSRHGRDADRLFRLFPMDPMMVRGFNRMSLEDFRINHGLFLEQISGSQMLIGNLEIRIPFTGFKRLALIPSNFLFTEFNIFADAGMAWRQFSDFDKTNDFRPAFLASTGFSLRINLFGSLILEPFYAFPIINGRFQRGAFGLNFLPGW